MPGVLIIGGTRGLGASLVEQCDQAGETVYATTRSDQGFPERVHWLVDVDLMNQQAGDDIVRQLPDTAKPLGTVIISAGHFTTEDLDGKGPQWDEERLAQTSGGSFLGRGSKVVLVSSESGSIALRHESKGGGGNYAHHASKAALNMVGRLLSLDLRDREVVVSIVHPGFMRTEMTKGVGFDKFWDDGGAVPPDEAATSLIQWSSQLDMAKSGEYWAPRGPRDIGTAPAVLGDGLLTPLW